MNRNKVDQVLAAYAAGGQPEREAEKAAVKETLNALIEQAPGHSVEVRVVPYAAVQAIPGGQHRRGTPPATVECDARTWLELAAGVTTWVEATDQGRVDASGERSNLSEWLPLA